MTSAEAAARTFTYAEAKALLPRVQQLTTEAVTRVARLVENAGMDDGDAPPGSEADAPGSLDRAGSLAARREQAQSVVNAWASEMSALGLVVKGLWLVDFDTGSGYYCWKHPETSIEYYHAHDEGFAGRVRIQ
jgi:hypothetical protein